MGSRTHTSGEGIGFLTDEYLTEAIIQKGLTTTFIGSKIYAFGLLKSTNDYAFRLAEDGAPEGSVVIAEKQTAGRGRFGRTWYSPPGIGIWCSVVFRPTLFPWEAPRMTMIAALAVARCIRKMTDLPVVLKWPNDIFINGRKVCGILTELSAEVESISFVIVGIGLNVNQSEEAFPSNLRGTATSLYIECGHTIPRIELCQSLLFELEVVYRRMLETGFSELLPEIKSISCVLQREVSVKVRNRTYKGKALDIDEQGGLALELPNGRIEHIIAGDVWLIEE